MGVLRDLKRENWERICQRCGLCCHEKLVSHDTAKYLLHSPCEYLDGKTNLCTAYSSRFSLHQRCRRVNLVRAMFAAYLPPDCGYVQWAKKRHIRFARRKNIVYIE